MKKILLILILLISFSNCRSSKSTKNRKVQPIVVIPNKAKTHKNTTIKPEKLKPRKIKSKTKADKIVNYALTFKDVGYKYGGTTKSGVDCSGLVFEVFRANDIILPRSSRDMAKRGSKIKLKNVQKGDLLFFNTGNRRNEINHVGLVVYTKNDEIEFIHSTNSLGVIITKISESYWEKAFKEARKIL